MKPPSRIMCLVTLVLVLTIGGGLAWNYYWDRQPDIDEVGGTILVYQMIDQRANQAAQTDAKSMAEGVQRRLAFDGLRHVTVRPGDAGQVEVRIPRVGDHDADVQAIKRLVSQVGRLEFRILANRHDDCEAIEDAQRMLNDERQIDAQLDQELKAAQDKGVPPPGPRDIDGAPKKYDLKLARGLTSTVTYSWVALGAPELRSLDLDNAARDDPARAFLAKEALALRGQAAMLPVPSHLLHGALFYSRECTDRNLPEQERRKKEVDYFVLARDPEFDPATGKRTPDIDGGCLASVSGDRDATGRPTVFFAFNPVGVDLVTTLTRKNVPDKDAPGVARSVRHLAIVLDGLVMSAPTINGEIRDRGTINGEFTQRQVAELVTVLRAGSLPGVLLPRPVREVTVKSRRGG